MSSSHFGVPQLLREDYGVPSHYRAPSMDSNDHQRPPVPVSDSRCRIPSQGNPLVGAPALCPVSECTPLLQPPISKPSQPVRGVESMIKTQTPTLKMFREELCLIPLYSLPVLGSQLFEYSFIIASVISIGHISTVALAAATLASMTATVTGYSIVQGFISTLDTLLPPAWTSETPYMVGLWSQRMALMIMGFVLPPILAIWFSAESILLTLNQEPEVARLAGIYLRWASLGLPAYVFNGISRRYFQSQGLFDIPTRITVVVAPINAFLNWLLVYPFGLSFLGAPLATAISFNLVSAASIIYGYHYVPRTAWSPISWTSLSPASGELWKGWGLLSRLGIAGVGQTASSSWSWELVGLAASQLGPTVLAAQSVLLLSSMCTFQAPFALSIATSVRIGNLLGQGNAKGAEVAAKISIAISIAMGCVFCALFLTFRHKWAYLFNNDPEVVLLVASILPLVALFQVFDGAAALTGGIFRARGKQSAGAILNISAYYLVGIPLGLYLTFVRGRALVGLWEGLTVSLVYISVIGTWMNTYCVDWQQEVVNAQGRVGAKKGGEETSV